MNEPSSGIPLTDGPSRKRPEHDDPSPLAAEDGRGPRNGRDGRRGAAPAGKASSAPLLGHDEEPTIFDFSVPGRRAASFRTTQVPEWSAEELLPPEELRPAPPAVAEVSERDLGRPRHPSHPQAVLRRPGRVPARLLHDEVQPQDL